MENAVQTPTLSPAMSNILAFVLLILIVYLLVNRSRKKHGKAPFRIIPLVKKVISRDGGKEQPAPSANVSASTSTRRYFGNYKKLITLDAFNKIAKKRYVVFDLETTGLDPDRDRIIEIGAVRVSGGQLTDQTFHQMVDPGCPIPAEASAVNHITDSMVRGQPAIKSVLADFLAYVDGDVLVAHNGGFDASFLDNACMLCDYEAPKKYFDTMRLSVYWPGLKNKKLETFIKAAGIENDNAHRALSDATATAKLCIKSMEKIR